MSEELFKSRLSTYLPDKSIPIVYTWLKPHSVKLKISKPRTSKLGDFKVDRGGTKLQISVNGNLNPYSFLITLTHEIAHLLDFRDRGHLREAHGKSWQNHYSQLLSELLLEEVFPTDLHPTIVAHTQRPKAASCSDPKLLNALRLYDENPAIRLKDLDHEALFSLNNGRQFKRGELRRTRFKCLELTSKKWYLIHGEAEVKPHHPINS